MHHSLFPYRVRTSDNSACKFLSDAARKERKRQQLHQTGIAGGVPHLRARQAAFEIFVLTAVPFWGILFGFKRFIEESCPRVASLGVKARRRIFTRVLYPDSFLMHPARPNRMINHPSANR